MFFSKCGNELNDVTVQTRSVAAYPKRNAPILESKERRFIIATGVIHIFFCIVNLFTTISDTETIKIIITMMPSEFRDVFEISIIIGCFIGFVLNIFLAVMVFLYKRWAFLVLRIIKMLNIVSLFFAIGQIIKVSESAAMAYILSLGLEIMILCFINISAKALSSDVQSCREITGNAKQASKSSH